HPTGDARCRSAGEPTTRAGHVDHGNDTRSPTTRPEPTTNPGPRTGARLKPAAVLAISVGHADHGSSARSARATRPDPTANSTNRARRYDARRPGPPCRPRTPRAANFTHRLSSLRLYLLNVQPSRAAASALVGSAPAANDPPRSTGSAS